MNRQNLWTEDEVTLALVLYLSRPFGQLRSTHPDVIRLAQLIGRSPGAVSYKLGNLGHCDASLRRQGIKGLTNGSQVDSRVWNLYVGSDRGNRPLEPLLAKAMEIADDRQLDIDFLFDWKLTPAETPPSEALEERLVLRKERISQNFFRDMVLAGYDGRCAITGLRLPQLVEAAHIIPWSERKSLRLLPSNGIALNTLLHRAYDANLLGIDEKRRVHVSKTLLRGAKDSTMSSFFEHIDKTELRCSRHFTPAKQLLEERFNDFLVAQSSLTLKIRYPDDLGAPITNENERALRVNNFDSTH